MKKRIAVAAIAVLLTSGTSQPARAIMVYGQQNFNPIGLQNEYARVGVDYGQTLLPG